jgi:hypothetical protein
VDGRGIVVRAALTSRRIPWTDVAELAAGPNGGVAVRLTSGASLTLPAVPARALTDVASVGGELTRA